MSLPQVIDAIDGHNEKEKARTEAVKIITWEATRWSTWVMWNAHVTKKGRISDPQKLLKFEWDKKPEAPKKEDWDRINSMFPDRLRNGNK